MGPLQAVQALRSAQSSCLREELWVAESDEFVTNLLDLADVPLADLRSLDHPILIKALQRVAEEARDSVGVVAGFQAAI